MMETTVLDIRVNLFPLVFQEHQGRSYETACTCRAAKIGRLRSGDRWRPVCLTCGSLQGLDPW